MLPYTLRTTHCILFLRACVILHLCLCVYTIHRNGLHLAPLLTRLSLMSAASEAPRDSQTARQSEGHRREGRGHQGAQAARGGQEVLLGQACAGRHVLSGHVG